jgi:hypothetical protein
MTTALYDGGDKVPAYWTPVRTQEQLDNIGFRDVHDLIVRILKSNLPAVEIGKNLRLYDKDNNQVGEVRISEFGNSTFNPEWVLGCKQV